MADNDRSELKLEAPPTYDSATKGATAPPSYEQVFGVQKMKDSVMEAKSSSSKGVFGIKLCQIFCGSVMCMIGLIILAALPVIMIVIGSVYFDDCEGRHNIVIWLVVFGVLSLIQTLINILKRCCNCKRKDESSEDSESGNYSSRGGTCFESLISFFLFIWIIIGSVWVFSFFDKFRQCGADPSIDASQCCDPVPYLFSFVTLVVIYVFSFLSLCCFCCCFVCLAFAVGAGATSE